jgi:hypothetical protein
MGTRAVKAAPALEVTAAAPVVPPVPDPDAGAVEAMAAVGASDVEIADYLGQPVARIVAQYAAILCRARAARGLRFREAEQRAAASGSARALSAAVRAVQAEQARRAAAERTRKRWGLPDAGAT